MLVIQCFQLIHTQFGTHYDVSCRRTVASQRKIVSCELCRRWCNIAYCDIFDIIWTWWSYTIIHHHLKFNDSCMRFSRCLSERHKIYLVNWKISWVVLCGRFYQLWLIRFMIDKEYWVFYLFPNNGCLKLRFWFQIVNIVRYISYQTDIDPSARFTVLNLKIQYLPVKGNRTDF